MTRVIVVIGPTSVGKTKMGVELAKALNGEVISGDSMQVYRGMNIGTAKVTSQEMEDIPHHCIDILEPDEEYSVKDFQDAVRYHIDEMVSRGKLPIIVGGTGLYIKAALFDYDLVKCLIIMKFLELNIMIMTMYNCIIICRALILKVL